MLIPCPHCGTRPVEEFTFLGDAAPTRPTTNVTVYVEAAGLKFSDCAITFTPETFNVPRTLAITPLPNYVATAAACISDIIT